MFPRLIVASVLLTGSWVSATNFTVKSGGGGNFTTIQACATAMAAGDTCTVFSGTYNETVTLTAGTVGNYKTITVNGSDVVTVKGFVMNSHTKLIGNCTTPAAAGSCGFTITTPSAPNSGACVGWTSAITDFFIVNNMMTECGSGSGFMVGSSFTILSDHGYIQGNTLSYACVNSSSINHGECNSIMPFGDHFLIERNDLSHYTLSIDFGTDRSIYRNNTFHDQFESEASGNFHTDAFFSEPGAGVSYTVRYNVFEGNLQYNAVGPNAKTDLFQSDNSGATCPNCFNVIFRNNIISRIGSGAASNYFWPHIMAYNNTLVDALSDGTPNNGSADYAEFSTNGSYLNQLYYFSFPSGTNFNVYNCGSGCNFGHNLYFCTGTCTQVWGHAAGTPFLSDPGNKIGNPLFTNYISPGNPANNYSLQAGSPAIGAGTNLTTAVGSGSGSTALTVADASYFQDGFGLTGVQPDAIRIGASTVVAISSINYGTNVITLANPATWANGALIYLYSNSSGTVVLNGANPDMGAVPVSGPPPPPGTNFYVATTGSDNNTVAQAQNPATPWQTLQHANDFATIGSTGTTIHVKAGTYTGIHACTSGQWGQLCATKGGTSTSARLTWQCDTPATLAMQGTTQGCYLQVTPGTSVTQTTISLEGGSMNNLDIIGFHFAPNAAAYGAVVGVCNNNSTAGSQCPNLNSVHLIGNLVERMGATRSQNSTFCNGNGVGAALIINNRHGHWVSDAQYIGNIIMPFGDNACKFGYAIYANGKNQTIQNQLTFGSQIGFHIYDQGCGMRVTNNTIINPADRGLIIWNTADFAGDDIACTPTGLNTLNNNIIEDVGVGYSPHQLSDSGIGMQIRSECDGTHPTLVSNNLMHGNLAPNFAGYQGAQPDACAQIVNTVTTEAPASTFVNYQTNGTGNYNLLAGSQAVSGGTSSCVAGGTTPCVPPTDIVGTVRPSGGAQSIGAYVFAGTSVPVVSFNPSPLNFGTVPVSTPSTLSDTLTNTGTATLTFSPATITGTNASVFVIVSTTCGSSLAPQASCSYQIRATPTATGAQSASLTLNDNASGSPHQLPLTVTGGSASLTASPTSLAYGVIAPGSCSTGQTTTFTNSGNVNLVLGTASITGTNAGDFRYGGGSGSGSCSSGNTLTPGSSCTHTMQFCPTTTGARAATDNQPSDVAPNVTVALSGSGGTSTATLLPASFNYGNQQVGTSSAAQAFTYTNTGTLALTITNVTVNSTAYSVSDNCPRSPATLAPSATCTANLTFRPVATGVANAVLTVTGSATQTSAVSGTGTQASITLSPTTVNFGNQLVGTTSAATTVTITNNGTASATIGSVSTATPFGTVNNTCGASLAASASCTVGVTFTPTATGLVSGQLIVADNAPGNPHTAALTGTGTAPAVTLTPSSNAYGNQAVGTSTVPFNFTFTNSGTGPVTISSVGIVGTNPSDFLVSTNTCGANPTLADTFSTGTLDSSKWIRDTGNSPAPGAGNTGTFSTANVSLSQGMLDLMLTQVAGSPIVSTGAEVRSINTFGYGTYTWLARAGSTSTTPTGSGSGVSGQVTGLFNYFQNNGLTAPNFTEDDFEIEGQFLTQLEMTSWSSASPVVNTETNSTQSGMDTAFHQYTYIWAPGRIDYYFDGALVSTHTTNVPSSPAFVIQNFYGTNGTAFGGTATTGTVRHLYVRSFSYTPSGTSLAAGASCTVGVSFKPTVAGSRAATLQVIDSASGSPHTSALTGTGTSLSITLSPSSLTFGSQTVGTSSATQAVTLTNTGNITLNISSIVASGDYSRTTTCGATVAAGGTCTITVTFTPTATGTRTGAITITDDANGSPQTVPLTGTGTAPTAPIATITPSSLTFGNQVINTTSSAQVLTLQNTGTATLNITSITASGDFARTTTCGATLATSASCTVSVTFTPTALGTRNGSITFVDDAAGSPQVISLTGTGVSAPAPQVSISPTNLTFASQTVGTTSSAQVLTLTNTGNATLNITSIVASGDYGRTTTCGATLTAGSNCTVSVTFSPTATGTRSGSIAFTDNATGSPQSIPLTGTGTAPTAPVVSLNPTSLTFASQTVGTTSAAQAVTLMNTGNATLTITSTVISGDYAISSTTCAGTLTASASCVFNITFTPTATGSRTGSLVLTDNAAGSPHNVQLTGTGAAPQFPVVSLSPTSLTFANQIVGTTSASQNITLTNTGTAALNITSIVASGDFARTTTCGATLAPSASCTVSVTFTPTAQGTRTGAVAFTDNASGSPQSVQLTGTGVPAPQPAVTFNPTSLTFPNTFVGSTTAAQDVTLTNSGTGTLNIASIVASGDYARTTTCGSTLAASASCLIHVTFTPTAPGPRAGLISVTDDAPGSPQTVSLNGTGVATSPAVCLSPSSINFGNQPVGTTSGTQPITVTNCGTANLIISSATTTGDFTASTSCATVAPQATCIVNAAFAPTTTGTRTGTVSIASNAASSPNIVTTSGFGTQAGATISPTSVNFGTVTVGVQSSGHVLTLTNTGNVSLTVNTPTFSGTNPSDFSFTGGCSTLAVNGSCTYSVFATPGGTGSRTGTFNQTFANGVSPVTVSLTVTGQAAAPAVTLTPSAIDFGSTTVGTSTPSQTITLTNSGTATLNVTNVTATGTNSGDVLLSADNCTGAAVPVGGLCTVSVRMVPGGTGARSANAHFITNAASSPDNTTLAVIGLAAPAPQATFTPTSLAFGNVKTGQTSASKTVTVGNIGNANLNISSITLGGANPSQYSQSNNCTNPVIPNSSCTVTVNFTPTTTGSKPATLVIVSDDPTNPTETITLSGSGKGHPKAVIGVTNINFGNTIVGTTSGPAAFTITNVGDATLNVSDISTSGDTFPQTNTCVCCPVAPGDSCAVSVQFNPQSLCGQFDPNSPNTCISDVHLGTVTIVNDGDSGTQTVAVQGLALPVPPPPGPITITLGGVATVGGSLVVGVQ